MYYLKTIMRMKTYLENKKRSLEFMGYSDETVSKILTQLEYLLKTEDSLVKEDALIWGHRIYPIMTDSLKIGLGKPSGDKFWIEGFRIYHESFVHTAPTNIYLPATDLHEISEITTYHHCMHQNLLTPTIYEVLCQIPKDLRHDVCAFELYAQSPEEVYSYPLDRHILKCVLYSGKLPKEIVDSPVFW